jgi:cobyrinic acid a,c-diamide synthase
LTLSIPRIVIAGTHSGVGKTSLSLALVSALKRRGLKVQTFKTGPDFLDPTYLALASGRPCYNLDGWMTGSRDYVCRLFGRVSENADLAVIEGVMGLFDGADPATIEGSTAEIAKWLQAPVLLIANAHGLGRSLAAMVKGYAVFEPGVNLAGVVANQCGSEEHAEGLALSLQASSLPPLLGAIPRGGFPKLPSRHLGLVTADTAHLAPASLDALAHALEEHTSWEDILRLARSAPLLEISAPERKAVPKRLRLAVARDRAFHFYYQDLFDELESSGCELIPFSPVEDQRLPGCDALYIGGGYPEEQAAALSANKPMLEAIRQLALLNRPIYGECGGLMYLAKSLRTGDGREYPMVGLLPAATRMLHRKKALGYVEITLKEDSLWGAKGTILRGHEFHYSELSTDPAGMAGWQARYTLRRRRAESVRDEGFQRGRVLVSYVHLHLASHPEAVRFFIDHCGENS